MAAAGSIVRAPSETSSETGPGSSPSPEQAGGAGPQVKTDEKVSQQEKTEDMDKDEEADIKIFNDSVHGTIRMHPLLVKIIDTPEFQRLRDIKQLGGAYRVYPAACHNRFEHSIGVCHLAGVFIEKLKLKQPQTVKVTPEQILCIKIAGLCHDIGHGPFSHLFDKEFHEICADKSNQTGKPVKKIWKHEEMSVKILKRLYTEELTKEFKSYSIMEDDLDFICKLINPPEGFVPEKGEEYLYQIVASNNGLDVDRWDYFARDSLQLGLKCSFDHLRCMEMARVIKGHICYRDKESVNIFNMFYTRFNLYRCAYYHPVNSAVQQMIAEAFWIASESLTFEGKDEKNLCLHEIYTDEVAYCEVTDAIYQTILRWRQRKIVMTDPEAAEDAKVKEKKMEKAQEILKRIEKRDFYQLVCDGRTMSVQAGNESHTSPGQAKQEEQTMQMDGQPKAPKNNLDQEALNDWLKAQSDFKHFKLYGKVVNIGFGGKEEDPLNKVKFCDKWNNPKVIPKAVELEQTTTSEAVGTTNI